MELSANKFGRHIIVIVQFKLKDSIVEILILVQNWRQLGGFFSNSHICGVEYLETEVPPQVEDGVFVLNCNSPFLLSII